MKVRYNHYNKEFNIVDGAADGKARHRIIPYGYITIGMLIIWLISPVILFDASALADGWGGLPPGSLILKW